MIARQTTLLLAIGWAIFATGCANSGLNKPSLEDSSPIVRLECSPCFGPCPTYTVEVYSDGRAQYHGERYTDLDGQWSGRVVLTDLNHVLTVAREMGFGGLEEVYDDPRIMDLPSQTFSIEGYTVKSRYGGPDFKPLKEAIEKMVAAGDWHRE